MLPVGKFRRQVEYLKGRYEILPLDTAFDSSPPGSRKPRAILTFDDGDVGLHTHLLGAIRELKVPVTLYVATRQIVEQKPFWVDRIMNAMQTRQPFTIDLQEIGLGTWTVGQFRGDANWTAVSGILEALKTLKPQDREANCDRILRQAHNAPAVPITPLPRCKSINFRSWRTAAGSPSLPTAADCRWVTIAAHSHCHNHLDQMPIEDAAESIEKSRQLLEEWTGRQVRHFAYPYGNHTPALENLIERMGFRSAAALGMALWNGHSDAYRLPRVVVGRYDSLDRFKLRLVGF